MSAAIVKRSVVVIAGFLRRERVSRKGAKQSRGAAKESFVFASSFASLRENFIMMWPESVLLCAFHLEHISFRPLIPGEPDEFCRTRTHASALPHHQQGW